MVCNIEGAGFIPALAAAWYLHQFLRVAGRTGINPVPTADVCNTLAINGLSSWLQHSATVGAWFIPALAAAWYLHQFLLVADRTGINPVPTATECYNAAYIQCRGGLYALPQKMSQPIWKNTTANFGKYVEHCFRKGMKPFPALAPLQLGEMRSMRQSSNGDMAHSNGLKEW